MDGEIKQRFSLGSQVGKYNLVVKLRGNMDSQVEHTLDLSQGNK